MGVVKVTYDEAKKIYLEKRSDESYNPAIPNFRLSSREKDSWIFRTQHRGKVFDLGRVYDDGQYELTYDEE